MKYYTVHAYHASLPELWRFSGKNPFAFLVAVCLKITRSKRFEFEEPDPAARQPVALMTLPDEVRAELKGAMTEIAACGYTLASVHRLEWERNVTFGLTFVGPREDRYIPLLISIAKNTVPPVTLKRYAILSLDADFTPIVTSRFPPQFEPSPETMYIYAKGESVAILDKIHSQEIREHPKPVIPITSSNVDQMTARMEESQYEYLRSRGIYSEKHERKIET